MALTGSSRSRPRWLGVADLAGRQKGLVARAQLLALGIAPGTLDSWVAAGRLHLVHPGVYLVGHRVMPMGAAVLAAVMACGPSAVLSHRSAAEHRKLIEVRPGFQLQVTVPGPGLDGPSGIYVHRTRLLRRDEVDEIDGVAVTSADRTLFDLASQAPAWEVAQAYEEGLIQGQFDRDRMIVAAVRHKGRRGITKIRALIDRDAPPSVTIQEAHHRLLELIRSSGLPHPKTEFVIDGRPADTVWEEAKLVVEMDGSAFHDTPSRIERDKARDATLAALGYLVIRVTWKELTKRPTAVIARIAATYSLRSADQRSRDRLVSYERMPTSIRMPRRERDRLG